MVDEVVRPGSRTRTRGYQGWAPGRPRGGRPSRPCRARRPREGAKIRDLGFGAWGRGPMFLYMNCDMSACVPQSQLSTLVYLTPKDSFNQSATQVMESLKRILH